MSWENFNCKQTKKEKRLCYGAFMIHSLYNYTVGEDYARSYAHTAVVGRRVFPQKDCIQEVILRHHYIIVERFPLIMLIKRGHENHSMAWCFLWAHVVDGDVAISSNEKKTTMCLPRDAGAAAAAADDEDEEALPEEEENRPILPYSSFFILSSTNP